MNKETHFEIIPSKIVIRNGEIIVKLEGYVAMRTSAWEQFCDEMEKLKRYAAGIEADGTEPYKDMIMDIRAAFGNRANSMSMSDADLLKQIYETLEEKP
jgi:hypothetical protein